MFDHYYATMQLLGDELIWQLHNRYSLFVLKLAMLASKYAVIQSLEKHMQRKLKLQNMRSSMSKEKLNYKVLKYEIGDS